MMAENQTEEETEVTGEVEKAEKVEETTRTVIREEIKDKQYFIVNKI
jgi:hypothetical protein